MADTLTAPANEIKQESDFVNDFATRLEKGEAGTDRGRAKQERVAAEEVKGEEKKEPAEKPAASEKAKPTASEKPGTAAEGTTSEESETSGKPKAAPDGEGEVEVETTETGKDKPAAEPETEGKPDKDKEDVDDDKDDVDDEGEGAESALAEEARAELEKHGLKMTLDDVPKEARPLVKAKLDNMTAAFTRAMMEARSYRKEEGPLKAEVDFIKKNPDLYIFEMLQADPSLADKINKRVEEGETDTGKEALKVVTRDKRKEALDAVQTAFDSQERVNRRADEIETYVRRACTNLNLPFDIVVESVVNRLNEKPDDQRNLTEEEIDVVIGRQQRIFAKRDGDRKREQRKTEIKGRTEDKKTVSPAAKSTAGTGTPAPAAKKPPANDADFIAHMEAQRGASKR